MKRLEKVIPNVNKKTAQHNEEAHQSGYFSFLTRDVDYDRYVNYHSLNIPAPLEFENENEANESKSGSSSNVKSNCGVNEQAMPLVKRLENLIRPHTAGTFLSTPGHVKAEKSRVPLSAIRKQPVPKIPPEVSYKQLPLEEGY